MKVITLHIDYFAPPRNWIRKRWFENGKMECFITGDKVRLDD